MTYKNLKLKNLLATSALTILMAGTIGTSFAGDDNPNPEVNLEEEAQGAEGNQPQADQPEAANNENPPANNEAADNNNQPAAENNDQANAGDAPQGDQPQGAGNEANPQAGNAGEAAGDQPEGAGNENPPANNGAADNNNQPAAENNDQANADNAGEGAGSEAKPADANAGNANGVDANGADANGGSDAASSGDNANGAPEATADAGSTPSTTGDAATSGDTSAATDTTSGAGSSAGTVGAGIMLDATTQATDAVIQPMDKMDNQLDSGNNLTLGGPHDVSTGNTATGFAIRGYDLKTYTGSIFTYNSPSGPFTISGITATNTNTFLKIAVNGGNLDRSENYLIISCPTNDLYLGDVNIADNNALRLELLGLASKLTNGITLEGKNSRLELVVTNTATLTMIGSILPQTPNQGELLLSATLNLDVDGTGTIGAGDNKLKKIEISAQTGQYVNVKTSTYATETQLQGRNTTLTIETPEFHGNITTDTPDYGVLGLIAANITGLRDIGTKEALLFKVEIIANNTIPGEVHAKTVEIADGKEVTLGGVFGDVVNSGDATTKLAFTDGATVGSAIKGAGKVHFGKSSAVNKPLGEAAQALTEVSFAGDGSGTHAIAESIHATDIKFTDSIVDFTNNATLNGNVTASGATHLNIKDKVLTFKGANNVLNDNPTIAIDFDGDKNEIGKIALDNGANINITNANINFYLNYIGRVKEGTAINTPSIKTGLGTINGAPAKITVNSNRDYGWTFDSTNWTFSGIAVASEQEKLAKDYLKQKGIDAKTIELFMALPYADEVMRMSSEKDTKSSLDRNFTPPTATTQVLQNLNDQTNAVIESRNITLTSGSITGNPNTAIVPAGDDSQKFARYGAWVSPFFSKAKQKKNKDANGYTSEAFGGTLGFDTMANDTMTIGIAGSYVKTKLKHKDVFSGDKTKIDTYSFNIYGNQIICDKYFVTGIASFGTSRIKDDALKIGVNPTSNKKDQTTAKSDHYAINWGGELTLGYHYNYDNVFTLIPTLGVAYNEYLEQGYDESGTRNQNRSISKKLKRKLDVIAGAKAVYGVESDNLTYTPEVHAYVKQAVVDKNKDTQIRIESVTLNSIKSPKPSKTTFNAGTSLTLQSGMLDYSIGYDLTLAKKYIGHQGTVKVRLNF